MRKTLSTVLALGVSFALMGCPPADSGKTGGGETGGTGGETTGETPPTTGETGGETGGDTGAAPAKKMEVDLSHVKVGQKYHYHMNNAGMEMDQVWEVTEMTDSEVKYSLTTIMNGNPVGDPTPLSWSIPKPVDTAATGEKDPNVKEPVKEKVTVAGKEWDALVVESGNIKTWVPWMNDMASFPPLLKQMTGDQVTNELTKIE